MPSAVADFPDRAPPSTSTRRPGRPLAEVKEEGAGAAPEKGDPPGDRDPGGRGAPGIPRSLAASPATSPITTTAGFVTPAACTAPARSRSGAVTTRCCRLQPSDTTAPGVPPPSP